jgi:sirohydrochlorin cobaltochelatase
MLILVAHGSRDPNWRSSAERLTESIASRIGPDRVRLAYMDLTPPTLEDVVCEAIGKGVIHLRVLPLFITNEGHVERDIRPEVDRLRELHPSVDLELLTAVGQHPLFSELLGKIALEEREPNV